VPASCFSFLSYLFPSQPDIPDQLFAGEWWNLGPLCAIVYSDRVCVITPNKETGGLCYDSI